MEMICCHSNCAILQVKEVTIIIDDNIISHWLFRQGLVMIVTTVLYLVTCSSRT